MVMVQAHEEQISAVMQAAEAIGVIVDKEYGAVKLGNGTAVFRCTITAGQIVIVKTYTGVVEVFADIPISNP